jgi:hypothetical protein
MTKLEQIFNEVNPKATLVSRSLRRIARIKEIIDNELPNLKAQLEADSLEGESLGVYDAEAKAEISEAVTKVEENVKIYKAEVESLGK